MKHQVKRYLAALLAAAMVFTMFPASVAHAAEVGDASVEVTKGISCSKYVTAGSKSTKAGTDGVESLLVGTNENTAEGTVKAAAFVDGETGKGDRNVGSARVAAMAFELPQIDAAKVSKATVTITIFDGNDRLSNGTETKAALFQVAADKYVGMKDDNAENAPGATFPAKNDEYGKDKTVYGDAWISYHNYTAQDQKVTFDVTDWLKESLANGDAYAIYRLQTVVGGFFVYTGGKFAPTLSITAPVPVSEALAQTLADISLPRIASEDIALPGTGAGNSQITWTCREEDKAYVAIAEGKAAVTRPAGANKNVQLTATATLGGISDSKVFDLIIAGVQGEMPKPMASFDFNTEAQDGKFVSGDVAAEINGAVQLQDRDEENGKALYLDGSASWLSLKKADGTSLLTGMEDVTISFDAKPDRTSTNWGFYAAPNENSQNGVETYIGALINGGRTTIERYHNGRFPTASLATGADWSHVDVVFTEKETALYVNGKEMSVAASEVPLSEILGDRSIFQIGKANWGSGEYAKGWIDNFKVYGQAVEVGQLCSPEALDQMVQADKEALTLNLTGLRADKDFTLPAKGQRGCGIAWASADEDIIAIDGGTAVVKRAADADKTVKLTATISLGGISDTKEFQVTVAQEETDAAIVQKALEKLQAIPNKDDIRDNIYMPSEVEVDGTDKKAAVTWTSSNDKVVTAAPSADGKKEPGIVNRPEPGQGDVQVTLQATVSSGDVSQQAEPVTVTVKEKRKQEKNTSYLFAHFTGTEGSRTDEQIYFATSQDGSQWTDMTASGNPALDSSNIEGGDGGVRDPYLLRSRNGDKFYLIATDLSINRRGGWGKAEATTKGSLYLVIWESTDLVNWSEPRLVDVASRIPGAGMAWAPEAYYDPDTGNYVVYWATASDESNKLGDRTNMYYATTRDFYTFSEPVLWIDRQHSIIDTTMIYDDTTDTYYRASGDGQITIEKSKSIYDGWEIIGTLSSIFNNNNYSGAKLEGPEFFEYCEDDWLKDGEGNPVRTWGLMCDQYAEGKGYLPFRTTDLADMTAKSWSPATDVNFGSLKKRHGTILPISDAEYKAVMKKYGFGEDETEEKVLAEFDFDTEVDLGEGAKGFASENAKAFGSYALQDSYSKEAGKALYLDGSTSHFLTVTDKNGGSLLAGVSEMTISYEFKPDRSDTNWVMYAAPNSSAPTYNREKYLGILANSSTTTLERYNNNGSRPSNPSVQTGSVWSRVDIVITKTDSTIYLNGEKKSAAANSYQLPAILGNSGILQIGKANWGNGEFCKGWIDNFRIKNKASSEAEIKELAAPFVSTLPAVSAAVVGSAPTREEALGYRGTDYHTAITSLIDSGKKEIQPYVRKHADLTKIPVKFELTGDVALKVNNQAVENGAEMNLTNDVQIVMERGGKAETWTIKKPILSNNPVLPGQYADPDIDYFDGKFWIYPTTDGYPSWSGTVFHAFSSPDMADWKDEGVILKLADQTPEKNEQGIQIATSPWAVGGSAWAPTIEKKNGKYYFYYCGKFENGQSAVGVAVADQPQGPYTDKGSALLTKAMTDAAGAGVGQAIDPSIFTDEDGTSYLLVGNGSAVIAELNEDMMSIKEGSIKRINGLTDFRESVIVTKKDGKYHWTWSCDDANSPNYHVNYGVSDKLIQDNGTVNVTLKKKNLLSKDESKNILGSAHQSVVHVQDAAGKDRYFMAYHRFYTPLNIFTSGDGLGKHRETCVDEITFDAQGEMVITPTLEGVPAVEMPSGSNVEVTEVTIDRTSMELVIGASESLEATVLPANATDKSIRWSSSAPGVASVENGKVTAKAAGEAVITAAAANGISASCTITVKEAVVEATSVTLDRKSLTLTVKESQKLKAEIAPSNTTDKALTWKSSSPAVASVASDGTVKGLKAGVSTITVRTANGKAASCTVTVKAAAIAVKKVTLDKTKLTLGVKEKYTLKAKVAPSNAASKKVTWKSDKKSVATISSKGVVTAKKAGTAKITATAGGKKAVCKITVKKAPSKVTLNANKKTIKKGKTYQLKVKLPKNTASNKITYTTSNKKVATVSASGKVKGVKKGRVTITAKTFNGKKARITITVK